MSRREMLRLEAENERARNFSAHVMPPCSGNAVLPVSDDYDYLRRGFFNRLVSVFSVGVFRLVGLFVGPYCRLKIEGKKNLLLAFTDPLALICGRVGIDASGDGIGFDRVSVRQADE